jgi:hypothetical protein
MMFFLSRNCSQLKAAFWLLSTVTDVIAAAQDLSDSVAPAFVPLAPAYPPDYSPAFSPASSPAFSPSLIDFQEVVQFNYFEVAATDPTISGQDFDPSLPIGYQLNEAYKLLVRDVHSELYSISNVPQLWAAQVQNVTTKDCPPAFPQDEMLCFYVQAAFLLGFPVDFSEYIAAGSEALRSRIDTSIVDGELQCRLQQIAPDATFSIADKAGCGEQKIPSAGILSPTIAPVSISFERPSPNVQPVAETENEVEPEMEIKPEMEMEPEISTSFPPVINTSAPISSTVLPGPGDTTPPPVVDTHIDPSTPPAITRPPPHLGTAPPKPLYTDIPSLSPSARFSDDVQDVVVDPAVAPEPITKAPAPLPTLAPLNLPPTVKATTGAPTAPTSSPPTLGPVLGPTSSPVFKTPTRVPTFPPALAPIFQPTSSPSDEPTRVPVTLFPTGSSLPSVEPNNPLGAFDSSSPTTSYLPSSGPTLVIVTESSTDAPAVFAIGVGEGTESPSFADMTGTTAPISAMPTPCRDDDRLTFWMSSLKRSETCAWLRQQDSVPAELCSMESVPYYLCRETCGTCETLDPVFLEQIEEMFVN